jgi:hypothetical protein
MKQIMALKEELSGLRRQVGAVDALRQQESSVESLRREMADLKETIWGPNPMSIGLIRLQPQSSAMVVPTQVTLKLPDAAVPEPQPPRLPDDLTLASLPAAIEQRAAGKPLPKSAAEEARSYLIETATPGYTMVRQGASVAIGRLHPDFAVKLAEAVRLARASGMTQAGVFSAYRPPAFGVGGFSDKFNSLHSYGLAADMTGIGRPGSASARRWQAIVKEAGLYLPYGADNRAEFNHTQLVPTKVAASAWRPTITASEPRDLHRMWLASGISAYVDEADAQKPPSLASASAPSASAASATVADVPLPLAGGGVDRDASAEAKPKRTRAPRRSRRGRAPKRKSASQPRARARAKAKRKAR